MELFNIGPLELIFVMVIALVVLGPKEMVNTAKKLSMAIAKIIRSPFWASLIDTTQEIRELPKKFLRESGLDENIQEISRMRSTHFPAAHSIHKPLQVKNDEDIENDPVEIKDDIDRDVPLEEADGVESS